MNLRNCPLSQLKFIHSGVGVGGRSPSIRQESEPAHPRLYRLVGLLWIAYPLNHALEGAVDPPVLDLDGLDLLGVEDPDPALLKEPPPPDRYDARVNLGWQAVEHQQRRRPSDYLVGNHGSPQGLPAEPPYGLQVGEQPFTRASEDDAPFLMDDEAHPGGLKL